MDEDSKLYIQHLSIPGFEQVIEATQESSGLHAFIAIHNTSLGPSLGGMRMFPYSTREEALEDALRLSKAMTLKSALIESGLGGGKSVLIGDSKTDKNQALFLAFAEVLNSLKGAYIAAEDVGITADDLLIVRKKSPYVAALPIKGSSGDPSRYTAFGLYCGIQAVCRYCFGKDSIKGKKILIQGIGSVGLKLAHFLFWEGAELILSDLDEEKLQKEAELLGAKTVAPKDLFEVSCDIFSPCAMGGIINADTIKKLKCQAIAGSANNQLKTEEDAYLLQEKHILFAPDFVINAGGIINAASEFLPGGYNPKIPQEKTARIYDTLLEIFQLSNETCKPPAVIAIQMAEQKLARRSFFT